jgi:hypothetical protein
LRDYKAIVELLLDNDRVDPEARDENGQTPLSAAAMRQEMGQESVVELLLASGRVDPDAKDARGLTPLAWASRAGSVRITEMLLSTGKVDVNLKDKLGVTVTPPMWTPTSHNDRVREPFLNSGRLEEGLKSDTAGDINSRYIMQWIESCDAQHGKQCKPAPLEHKSPQQLPHWVIDINRACLVPGNTVSRYIALSYVWSQGLGTVNMRPSDSILLRKSNLSDFRTPGFLQEVTMQLPNAVTDAVVLVRTLGDNYLWVDCLCIVQDDEKTRNQVDHMGDIYSGAHLTIIAATPWGMLHGFSSPWRQFRGEEEVEDLYEDLYRSKWATRGWTFQEQMLSRRAIVFSNSHMFWECQHCVWSLNGPSPETTTGTFFKTSHYDKASRMLSSCYPDFDLYTEMISLYNSRVFTYPQDVLPAFSGVLTTLGRSFPSGFMYCLPRIHLDVALLWQPFHKAHRRVPKDEGTTAPKTHLPSWSWCGWTCPIDPYHLRTRYSYFNKDHRGSQLPIWKIQKLVQWYSLPANLQCQVPADRLLIFDDGASIDHRDHTLSNRPATHTRDNSCPIEENPGIVHSAYQETGITPLLSPTPLSASPQYVSQSHDAWPFLLCQTSCLSLHIKAIFYSFPASYRAVYKGMRSRPSTFKLPQFAEGSTPRDTCGLICLETQEGLSAGTLRHMEKAELKLGDTVELIAISTGAINSAGVEGDKADKLYKLVMKANVGYGWPWPKTSEYLGQYHSRASMLFPKA